MHDIQPRYLTFGDLLRDRLFRIPEYQRAYSWGDRQREDLFADITEIADDEERVHFMATVVAVRRGKRRIVTEDYFVSEIVDGQQRITTLVILLKSIAVALDREDSVGERIGRELDELLVKPDDASLLLLQTNHDSSSYFADFIRTGATRSPKTAVTIADREILGAMAQCAKFVQQWSKGDRTLADLVILLKNRLTVILHELSSEALVYSVFEVLNNRGLAVAWLDRLKSMLMGIAFATGDDNRDELISELHSGWKAIYRCVGLRQGLSTEALRFAATLQFPTTPNRPLGEEAAVDLLREQSDGPRGVLDTSAWILAVTEAVDKIARDRRRNAVCRILQARLLAAAIHLRDDLSDEERERALHRWESVTFRIYGLFAKDARTRVGDYVRLAWRVHNERLSVDDILDGLASIGRQYPARDAAEELRDTDCYNDWTEELRYFLARYEEHLAKRDGLNFDNEQWNRIWEASAADSIEHVLPKSKGEAEIVHRLGNLVLLPPRLNSKLGAKTPQDKKNAYEKAGLLMVAEIVPSLDGWGEQEIVARENRLIAWAREAWAD